MNLYCVVLLVEGVDHAQVCGADGTYKLPMSLADALKISAAANSAALWRPRMNYESNSMGTPIMFYSPYCWKDIPNESRGIYKTKVGA